MKMCFLIRQVKMAIRFAYQIGEAKHARLSKQTFPGVLTKQVQTF